MFLEGRRHISEQPLGMASNSLYHPRHYRLHLRSHHLSPKGCPRCRFLLPCHQPLSSLRSTPREGPRVDQRAALEASVFRGDQLCNQPVEVGAGIFRLSQKSSGFLWTISGMSSGNVDREKQQEKVVIMDSGVFHMGVPVQEQKLLRLVDASQICMGPQDSPGFWLVTGAKLDLEKGKIALHVKFFLLTDIITQDLKSV